MKIVSYNIANYDDHPNWPIRKKLLATELAEIDADIIALQEVRYNIANPANTDSADTAEEILQELQLLGKYQDAYLITDKAMFYGSRNFWEGVSLISKYDIIEQGILHHTLLETSDLNKRVTQYSILLVENEVFAILNTHLTYDQRGLEGNVTELLDYSVRFTNFPTIILGDMNATPENPAMEMIANYDFIDSYDYLQPGKDGFTYPTKSPSKRIDYIWINQILEERLDKIMKIGTAQSGGIYPSDHCGIYLELK